MRLVRSRLAPLSRPMPAPPAPPEAVRVPAGVLPPPRRSARPMRREVPSPREMPAQPAPLSNQLSAPSRSSSVTRLARPRSKALPEGTRHTTPPRVSSVAPTRSARATLPLKGTWLASSPAPPEMAVTRLDKMRRVWDSSS